MMQRTREEKVEQECDKGNATDRTVKRMMSACTRVPNQPMQNQEARRGGSPKKTSSPGRAKQPKGSDRHTEQP